jgi:hypothetical protein
VSRDWVRPEPQIVPAPYDFTCLACGEDVEENEPISWAAVGGPLASAMPGHVPLCQECACTRPE